jgi:ATP-dependent DNA ligase
MTQSLQPIPSYRVYSMKEAQAIADEYISEGFEGAVVKKLDTIWEDGTSKDMVKIKEVYDADLYCVGPNTVKVCIIYLFNLYHIF